MSVYDLSKNGCQATEVTPVLAVKKVVNIFDFMMKNRHEQNSEMDKIQNGEICEKKLMNFKRTNSDLNYDQDDDLDSSLNDFVIDDSKFAQKTVKLQSSDNFVDGNLGDSNSQQVKSTKRLLLKRRRIASESSTDDEIIEIQEPTKIPSKATSYGSAKSASIANFFCKISCDEALSARQLCRPVRVTVDVHSSVEGDMQLLKRKDEKKCPIRLCKDAQQDDFNQIECVKGVTVVMDSDSHQSIPNKMCKQVASCINADHALDSIDRSEDSRESISRSNNLELDSNSSVQWVDSIESISDASHKGIKNTETISSVNVCDVNNPNSTFSNNTSFSREYFDEKIHDFEQDKSKDRKSHSSEQDKSRDRKSHSSEQDKSRDRKSNSSEQDKSRDRKSNSSEQDKSRDRKSHSSEQDKSRDRKSNSSEQEKSRDRKRHSSEQNKSRDRKSNSSEQDKSRDRKSHSSEQDKSRDRKDVSSELKKSDDRENYLPQKLKSKDQKSLSSELVKKTCNMNKIFSFNIKEENSVKKIQAKKFSLSEHANSTDDMKELKLNSLSSEKQSDEVKIHVNGNGLVNEKCEQFSESGINAEEVVEIFAIIQPNKMVQQSLLKLTRKDNEKTPQRKHERKRCEDSVKIDNKKSMSKSITCTPTDNGQTCGATMRTENIRRSSRQESAMAAKRLLDESAAAKKLLDEAERLHKKQNEKATAKLRLQEKVVNKSKHKKNGVMVSSNKDMKLASIFLKESAPSPPLAVVKAVLSPSKLKAREEFLLSGVPVLLKQQMLLEKSSEELKDDWLPYPDVSHTQQKEQFDAHVWDSTDHVIFPWQTIANTDWCHKFYEMSLYVSQFPLWKQSLTVKQNTSSCLLKQQLHLNVDSSLKQMVDNCRNSFPVMSVYQRCVAAMKSAAERHQCEVQAREMSTQLIDLAAEDSAAAIEKRGLKRHHSFDAQKKQKKTVDVIKNKHDESESMSSFPPNYSYCWTETFSPNTSEELIGNEVPIVKLKLWLEEWRDKCASTNQNNSVLKGKRQSSESDWSSDSNSNSCDDDDSLRNTIVLAGPPGVGKTSTVYALANQLGFKVIEVNASSRRPGKQVTSQLAEATQSHSMMSHSNKSSDQINQQKQGMKCVKKENDLTLVLFEDIDIMFEEWDEGFYSAVNTFMAVTKRPIILTLNEMSECSLARIKGNFDTVVLTRSSSELIGCHLQCICLCNGFTTELSDLQQLAFENHCDIRKLLLQLQFWLLSATQNCKKQLKNASDSTDVNDTCEMEGDLKEDLKPKLIGTKLIFGCKIKLNLSEVLKMNYWLDLPLVKKRKETENKTFPLSKEDCIDFVQKKYTWLTSDEEEEDSPVVSLEQSSPEEVKQETPEVTEAEEIEQVAEMKQTAGKVKRAATECVTNLSDFVSTLSELSFLSCHNLKNAEGDSEHNPTVNDFSEQLSLDIFHSSCKRCHKELREITSDDFIKRAEQMTLNYKTSEMEQNERLYSREVDDLKSLLPVGGQFLKGRGLRLDIFPYVRNIARIDERNNAIKSYGRNGRKVLQHLPMIGVDISASTRIHLANIMN